MWGLIVYAILLLTHGKISLLVFKVFIAYLILNLVIGIKVAKKQNERK